MEQNDDIPSSDEITHKILYAYRNKKHDKVLGSFGLVGIVSLIGGVIFDSTPLSVGGASCVGLATVNEGIEYMKAYFEARLDYLQNNRFTKL